MGDNGWRRLRMNWLVPEPSPGAGGDTGLFRIIRLLAEFGHDCRVHIVPYGRMDNFSDHEVGQFVREHFGLTSASYQKWRGSIADADCSVATFWPTAELLLSQQNGGKRFYLVQDFEPFFYPGDAAHVERAERTYRAGLHCITLGPWLAKLLGEKYSATADHFDFAVDTGIYFPRNAARDFRKRICFYARPSTPRRAYQLGADALALVKARLPEAEIAFFGAAEIDPPPAFPFSNRGLLSEEALATLFSTSDIGLVLSLTNLSFVPLEMMGCGCAVVELASERVDGMLSHGIDSWLVQPTPQAIADGIVHVLTDAKLRGSLIARAKERTREMSWAHSVRQIEEILLRNLGPETEGAARSPGAVFEQLPSRSFQPRICGVGAWTNHLHFAYDAVALLQPKVLVELGVDRGESYFAFCQSIAETKLPTRAFAVDTWRGDAHAGDYDETTFREVSAHNAEHYAAFSTLLRMTFGEARSQFAENSIDLLHVDGLHTEEALRRDLQAWLPKLRPGGILLLHDVNERRRDFGVWKVWQELRREGRSFTLEQGPGLGIWQKPPALKLPQLLESLFNGDGLGYALFAHYRNTAAQLQQQITEQWADGSIRNTALAHQTVIQVFHSVGGVHNEEASVLARVGHDEWKKLRFVLPAGSQAAPLRVDFVTTFHVVEIASLRVLANEKILFSASSPTEFGTLTVLGDATVLPDENYFRLEVTGIDPQIYLPALSVPEDSNLSLEIELRVA